MFRNRPIAKLIAALLPAFAAGCLREVPPPSAPGDPVPSVASAPAKPPPAYGGESGHDLFIAALTCFGAPVYVDAIGVEPREASLTIARACAPLERAAGETRADVEDEDAYVGAVRSAVDRHSEGMPAAERGELLSLFDKGLSAVREARSPWGRGPWSELVALADTLTTRELRDEARGLAMLLEADRLLRGVHKKDTPPGAVSALEARLVEQSSRLAPSDLRTALDGVVQRLRTTS